MPVLPRSVPVSNLSTQTGGRIVFPRESDDATLADLATLTAEIRTQYRLVYRPSPLKHDGSFHHIELTVLHGEANLTTRSGYYAPWH